MPEVATPPPPAPVYLDGRLVPAAAAVLPADDHGVLFGLGFYETFRTSGGRPHLWSYHRQRLGLACARAGISLPSHALANDEERLRAVAGEMLKSFGVHDAVFRYTITAGTSNSSASGLSGDPLYAEPHELMTVRAAPAPPNAEGVRLHVLNLRRDSGEWLPRPKSIACANVLLGAAELRQRAAEPADEGLLLNREDRWVIETLRQNVAWISDGRLCYPDLALGAIAGTCLAWVLELGCPSAPRRAHVDELLQADAVLVMNSVRGITPVREIRGQAGEVLRAEIASHEDPFVTSLSRQWSEALDATARGA
ncbi:aminotransferase class IV [Opitutus terrae]|uniref:Aminotransferase class IV n=1 Tax=Opitutus terrae (strain DSM 11246 / JCM 15787 / PB90-1) TaxID=452637 RepID=B1ZQM5_OPITP|nr:aminotransferase class IV [Opitutus terrae]ACB75634.1 aminotransferase class IV [Opitutus terrae PB90-1]